MRGAMISTPSRRLLMQAGLALGAGLASGVTAVAQPPRAQPVTVMPAQTRWQPMPVQAPQTEGVAPVNGAKLWYWDTGGKGEVVVLLHPATGSGAIWGYQQPALAKAGFRVIGYSRRGHYKSDTGVAGSPGTSSGDLIALLDYLKIDKVHLVGLAAGGFLVPDVALSYPERLHSITVACSLGGINDADYGKVTRYLQPEGFDKLPQSFRELGPSYRAANPAGVAEWEALEHVALSGTGRFAQPMQNQLTWARVETIRTPAMLLTGDGDLYQPPARIREFGRHLPQAKLVVVSESGHSVWWEQPDAFNRALIDFFKQNRRNG